MSLGKPNLIGSTHEPVQIAGLIRVEDYQHVDVRIRGPITSGSRPVEPNTVYAISEMLAHHLGIKPEQTTHSLQAHAGRLCSTVRFHAVSLICSMPFGQGERGI